MSATRKDLEELQGLMAQLLAKKIRDGTATASDLREANALLARNGIVATSGSSQFDALLDEMDRNGPHADALEELDEAIGPPNRKYYV